MRAQCVAFRCCFVLAWVQSQSASRCCSSAPHTGSKDLPAFGCPTQKERKKERSREVERESVCVCVCVFTHARESHARSEQPNSKNKSPSFLTMACTGSGEQMSVCRLLPAPPAPISRAQTTQLTAKTIGAQTFPCNAVVCVCVCVCVCVGVCVCVCVCVCVRVILT